MKSIGTFLSCSVSYSHRVSSWPLVEALVQKGHQVTFIGPFPSKVPNPKVTDIVPKALNKYINHVINENFDVTHRAYGLTPKFVMVYDLLCYQACSELVQSEEFKAWLKTDPNIDLIYSDTTSECAYGLVSKFKSKHGLILPLTFISKHFDMYGIPPETSTIPDWDVTFKPPLTFWGRSVGAVIPLLWRASQLIYYRWYASLFHDHLGLENVPSLDEMQAVTSIILINGDFIEDYPRSFPPFVVKVPGMHVKSRNDFLSNKPVSQVTPYPILLSQSACNRLFLYTQDIDTSFRRKMELLGVWVLFTLVLEPLLRPPTCHLKSVEFSSTPSKPFRI